MTNPDIDQTDIRDFLETQGVQTENVRLDLEEIQLQLEESIATVPTDERVKTVSGLLQTLKEYLLAISFTSFDKGDKYISLPQITGRDIDRFKREHNLNSSPRPTKLLSESEQSSMEEDILTILDQIEDTLSEVGSLDEQTTDPEEVWFQATNLLVLIIRKQLDNGNFNSIGSLHSFITVYSETPKDVVGLQEKTVRLASKFDNSIDYDFNKDYDEDQIESLYAESMSFVQGLLRDPSIA